MPTSSRAPRFILAASILVVAAVSSANATPITYSGAATGDLSVGTNWNSGSGPAPGSGDIATWTGSQANNALIFGADANWSGIAYGDSAATTAVINTAANGTTRLLTLGADGISLTGGNLTLISNSSTSATSNLLNLSLAADQSWTVASGKTFKYQGSSFNSASAPGTTTEFNGHTLTLNGAGTVEIDGTKLQSTGGTGTINLNSGTLVLAGLSGSSRENVTSAITVNVASTTLLKVHDSAGSSTYAQTTNLNGGTMSSSGANGATVSGSVVLGNATTSTLGVTGGNLTVSGQISGSGNLIVGPNSGKTVTLSNASNTYSGTTTVTSAATTGTLLVNSAQSGTGAVNVTLGTLGGTGSFAGALTIGDSTGSADSFITGGTTANVGTLTTSSTLSLNSDSVFSLQLNSTGGVGTADKLVANGVTLNVASTLSITDIAVTSTALTLGTIFTVIDNTSAGLIAGTFASLPEGSVFTTGANQYKVSYIGGTGANDMTLTVVPEPGSVISLIGGLGVLMGLRRRRN